MTFASKMTLPIKVDNLRIVPTSDSNTPVTMNLTGSLNNTSATFSSTTDQITLPSGSHWRIVFQCGQYGFAASTGTHTAGIYSVTDSVYLGQEAYLTDYSSGIRGRGAASCLILNSDISGGSKVIECRYKTLSSNITYRTNYNTYQYFGVLIMELPA